MHFTFKHALILAFSLMLLIGCSTQGHHYNPRFKSTKRYRRDCGCFLPKPIQPDLTLNSSAHGQRL
jgi:hypothetical protein